MVTKANRRATVHRPGQMDIVGIKRFDADGKVAGERLFVGLFTSAAYSRSPARDPAAAPQGRNVHARARASSPTATTARRCCTSSRPFRATSCSRSSEDELFETALGILHLQERQRIALFMRRDPFERFVSCLVYVPRDRYNTELRVRFGAILAQAFNGEVAAFYTQLAATRCSPASSSS